MIVWVKIAKENFKFGDLFLVLSSPMLLLLWLFNLFRIRLSFCRLISGLDASTLLIYVQMFVRIFGDKNWWL